MQPEHKAVANDYLINSTKDNFLNNPIFQDTNPNAKRNKQIYIDELASKGFNKNELEGLARTPEEKELSDKFLRDRGLLPEENKSTIQKILGYPKKLVDSQVEASMQGMEEGGKQMAKGMEKSVDIRSSLGDIITGGANAVAGAAKAAFGVAGAVVPELVVFNAATTVIKDSPESVKAKLYDIGTGSAQGLSEKQKAENFDKTIDFPFAAASTIATEIGYNPEEGSFGKAVLEIVNLALPMVLGHAVIGGGKIKTPADFNEVSRKIADNKASEQEIADYVRVSDGFKGLTVEQVQKAAKDAAERDAEIKVAQEGRAELGIIDDHIFGEIPKTITNTIERIHEGKPTDPVALAEATKYLDSQFNRLQSLKNDNSRSFTTDQINEAIDQLSAAKEDINKHQVEQNDMSPELIDLHNKADELQKASGLSPESMNDIQRILADVKGKINEQAELSVNDKIEQAKASAEVHDIDRSIESEQEGLKANAHLPEVSKVIEGKIESLKARKAQAKAKVKPFKPFKEPKGADYSKGKTSVKIAKEQGIEFSSPEEADRHIAEESQNPLEIADRYLQLDEESALDMKSHTDQLLDEAGIKLTAEEFAKISDKNNIDPFIKKKFLDEVPETHYDKKLQEINEHNGINITHADLVDYIQRSQMESYMPNETGMRTKFRNKFEELTGQKLTPSKAKIIIESELKKYNLHEQDYHHNQGLSAAELEQHYYEGIKEGRIKPFDNEQFSDVKGDKESGKGESKPLSKREQLEKDEADLFLEWEHDKLNDKLGSNAAKLGGLLTDKHIAFAVKYAEIQIKKGVLSAQEIVKNLIDKWGEKFDAEDLKKLKETINAEIDKTNPKEIGISKEMREKQLEELGLPKPKPVERDRSKHTHEYLVKEANRIVDSKEIDPVKLAEEMLEGSVEATDLLNIVLERGALDLDAKINELYVEKNKASANGDRISERNASDKVMESLADLNKIHEALRGGLTKAAEVLASAQATMRQDFSIGNLYTRFKNANKNVALPAEFMDRIANYGVEIAELNVKIKEQEALLQKHSSDINALQSKKVSAEKIVKVREKRAKLFDDWKELRNSTSGPVRQGLPFGDKDVVFASKIALSYIEEGLLTSMEVGKQLKADVKKHLGIKLTDEQIFKILDIEVDGKKVIDNFENTGIPSRKLSLSDLVEKTQKRMSEPGEPVVREKKSAEQKEKEGSLIKNTNKALNDLRIAREKIKRKVNNEEAALEYVNKTKSEKTKELFVNVLNMPRSLMASFDFSAPLRQGLVASAAHPISASKATVEMFSQAFSQKNFDNWLIEYKLSPKYELAEKSGLYVADPASLHAGLKGREEAFASNLAERIPVVGKGIKASERAYVGYLNKLRTDVFENGAKDLMDQGFTFEKNPEKFEAWAEFVNNSTGRGKLPTKALEDAAPVLNSLFFSPRLIASRINLINPLYYKNMPPEVRVKAIADMAKFVGLATTALALAKLSGADVETDPRSSDFGKIRDGDTRWDMLGGFQQYIRATSQFVSGQKKSTATGKIIDLSPLKFPYQTRGDVVGSFVRNKLSPATGFAWNMVTGKDAVGLPITMQNELYTHLTPLQLQGALEAYKEGGYGLVAKTMIPSMFGVGVQTYNSKKTKRDIEKQKREENKAH